MRLFANARHHQIGIRADFSIEPCPLCVWNRAGSDKSNSVDIKTIVFKCSLEANFVLWFPISATRIRQRISFCLEQPYASHELPEDSENTPKNLKFGIQRLQAQTVWKTRLMDLQIVSFENLVAGLKNSLEKILESQNRRTETNTSRAILPWR